MNLYYVKIYTTHQQNVRPQSVRHVLDMGDTCVSYAHVDILTAALATFKVDKGSSSKYSTYLVRETEATRNSRTNLSAKLPPN